MHGGMKVKSPGAAYNRVRLIIRSAGLPNLVLNCIVLKEGNNTDSYIPIMNYFRCSTVC